MAVDLSLELRQAIVVYMRANAGVVAQLGQRFFGERPPEDVEWPFARYGFDTVDPFLATGVNGGEIDVTIHTFAKGDSTDVLKPINKAVVAALDDAQLELDDGWCLDLTFVQAQTLPDGPDGFHGVVRFTALTGKDA